MQAIWKYPLRIGTHHIPIPCGDKVLTVQKHNGVPCIWLIVTPNAEPESRTFTVYGTGHEHPVIAGEYLGSFYDGSFVGHVFEIKTKEVL